MAEQYCTACGKQLPAEAKFCLACGAAVAGAKASAGTAPRKAVKPIPSGPKARDFVIVIAALLVVTVGYFIFRTPQAPPQPPQQAAGQGMQGHPDVGGGPSSAAMGAGLQNLPTDLNGLVQFGNQSMDAGNFAVAAEAYRRALAINPDDVNVRTDFGACLHSMGLPDRALEEFRTVVRQDPAHGIAHFNSGIVFHDMGKLDSAKFYWEKYLQMEPNGPAAAQARELLKNLNG